MYPPAEEVIHPLNRAETHRLFVIEDIPKERFLRLGASVMNVYSRVTGKEFSYLSMQDYPEQMYEDLNSMYPGFEFRFGMPRAERPARDNGKLRGARNTVLVGERSLQAVGFYIDTNDFSYITPQPELSKQIVSEFNAGVRGIADYEFTDISIPAPHSAIHIGYNPSDYSPQS